jgi:hypothetical protein
MNEDDRNLFELRNELAQAIETGGRTGLQKQLALVQWLIGKRARGECPHIHAEDWPKIRNLLDLPNRPGNMFGPPNWGPAWPRRKDCTGAGDHQ